MDDAAVLSFSSPDTHTGSVKYLMRRLIEKVTVYEDKAVVKFKSGLETDVEI